ncbi:5'-methylthioadenosine/adenosylhomocysteine nucleosidase [Enterococcus camelliae]|uniref:5'-methylthioadenosine/S-adenosylhomocysteine nucleosidase n=1 Tax=Enterococcus camelliae TaxID=453959 RepID=A0ABW5TLC7_9ENTE
MKIGIIGAMSQEVALLREALVNEKTWEQAGAKFYSGTIEQQEVIVVESGIGKVAASITASLLIQKYGVEAIVNTGSAGGIGKGLAVGDMVLSTKLAYHDVDVTGFGYEYGQLPAGMPLYFEADARLLNEFEEAARINQLKTKKGLIVTGDAFINNQASIQHILHHFPEALACEMEGAAIAQTAFQFGVPFLVIRAMSDTADHQATQSFDEFIEKAGKQSANMVLQFINNHAANQRTIE